MLRKQLYRLFIFTLLIPMIVIGFFLIYNNYRMLYQQNEDMLVSDNLRVKSVMFETTTSITNICDALRDDVSLQEVISTEYGDVSEARKALENFDLLHGYYERHTEVSSIILYTNNDSLFSYEHIMVVDDTNQSWFDETIQNPGYNWSTLMTDNQFGITSQELQILYPVSIYNSDYDAVLQISLSNNYLKNRVQNNNLEVDITVNHDQIFYSTTTNEGEVIDFNNYYQEDFYQYSGYTEFMGNNTLLETSTIRPVKADDSIYVFTNNPEAIPEINQILIINIAIVVFSILLPLFIIVRYTKQLSYRVNTLKTEMHRVTMGDYNIIDKFKGNDELADLFKDLQNMIESIKEKNQAIFEGEIKEQKLVSLTRQMEFDLLSSKINPHFLYNTLETIRMKALSMKDVEVAEAIKMIGQYMRYNLESTGHVTTLSSEMVYIEIYLYIQKLRFSDRIEHFIHVDEHLNLDEIQMLPLLIQPIVENAFNHGHEETTENGMIFVNILDEDDHILIQVVDNGIGIKKSKLRKLMNRLNQESDVKRTNFGLYNIHNRLKLFYGDNYGLEITSLENKGTTIQFHIPK